MRRALSFCLGFFLLLLCSGCFVVPQSPNYPGPQPVPPEVEAYYRVDSSYTSFKESAVETFDNYQKKTYDLETAYGPMTVDWYASPEGGDDLVFVFPVLGGKPVIEGHFARYFVERGLDAAIVRRSDEFKKPEKFFSLEQIFRDNVRRDRIVIDFFEREIGKKNFGGFGLSRGAINVAMTAAVDKRLKHNILCLGGSDLYNLFKKSNQRSIKKYITRVMDEYQISNAQVFTFIQKNIKTDPKNLASFIDARNTKLILALFDRTVPIKYGLRLRDQIGRPETLFLVADHYTGLLYTRFSDIIWPDHPLALFPLDYLESESTDFFNQAFSHRRSYLKRVPLRILRVPFDMIGQMVAWFL